MSLVWFSVRVTVTGAADTAALASSHGGSGPCGGRHRAWRAVLSGFGHACHPRILTEETHAVMLPSCGCRSRVEHGMGKSESTGANAVG